MDDNRRFAALAARLGLLAPADATRLAETATRTRRPAWDLLREQSQLGPEAWERLRRAWEVEQGGPQGTRYESLGELGRGGMGVVLKARDPALGREVAQKVLLAAKAGPAQRQRFLAEARVTGQLEHPNIVPVHELAEDATGAPFFTMKLVRGRSLEALLKDGSRDPANPRAAIPELLRAFSKVCDAIAYAHSRGVLHRDLKPANVMLGDFGEVLVMDWGLARVRGQPDDPSATPVSLSEAAGVEAPRLTQEGEVMGTPAYMPPEQAEGQLDVIDERSDVYALGAILYQLLALRPPFQAGSLALLLKQVLFDPPAPPRRTAPRGRRVPRELEAIALKALAKEPEERYPDVPALAADVTAWLEGRPVSAFPAGPLARGLKWAARHKELSATVVVGLLLLLAVLTGAAFLLRGKEQERMRVLEQAMRAEQERAAAVQSRAAAMEPYLRVASLLERDLTDEELAAHVVPELERAVALDPSFAEAHLRLGQAWVLLGQSSRAEEALRAAAEAGARSPQSAFLLGQLALLAGRKEEGIGWYRQAAAGSAGDPFATLARLCLEPQAAGAEQTARALLEAHPCLPEAHLVYVDLLGQVREPAAVQEAQRVLIRALRLHQPSWVQKLRLADSALMLGALQHELGGHGEALRSFQQGESLLASLPAGRLPERSRAQLLDWLGRHADSLLRAPAPPPRDLVGEAGRIWARMLELEPASAGPLLLQARDLLGRGKAREVARLLPALAAALPPRPEALPAMAAALGVVAGVEAGDEPAARRALASWPDELGPDRADLEMGIEGWDARLLAALARLAAAGEQRAAAFLVGQGESALGRAEEAEQRREHERAAGMAREAIAAVGTLAPPGLRLKLHARETASAIGARRYEQVRAGLQASAALVEPLLRGEGDAALVALARSWRRALGETAAQHGRALLAGGKSAEALAAAETGLLALAGLPDAPLELHLNLLGAHATAAFNLGRHALAVEQLEASLRLNPGADPGLRERAAYDAWNLALARAHVAGERLASDAAARSGVLDALEQAAGLGFRRGELVERQAVLAPLRGDPRFEAAMRAFGGR